MNQDSKPSVKSLITQAFAVVYTDVDQLVKDQAMEHTIANMGQCLEDFARSSMPADRLIRLCYQDLRQQCESDEMADGIDEEYRDWLKEARKSVAMVQKKGLPLTLTNTRDAFERKGAFAAKK